MNEKKRCGWSSGSESMRDYHDVEWGFPTGDEVALFEKINLEGFQSGLSWKTVLDKRANFRRVFHGFDIAKVARMGSATSFGCWVTLPSSGTGARSRAPSTTRDGARNWSRKRDRSRRTSGASSLRVG